MSLIAKFVSPGDAGGAPRSREWSEAPAAEAPGAPHAEPSSFLHFDLDFGRLASQGFVTPQAVDQSIRSDIRTIKRRLLRRLNFLRRDEGDDRQSTTGAPAPVALVTSSEPDEGKTFFAINLALSLAIEERFRVLLVDGDLIKPSIRSVFDLPAGPGLGDSFRSALISPAFMISSSRQIPLGIVGAGNDTRAYAEALVSQSLPTVLNRLGSAFEARLVIVDGPPLLATTEAALLAQHVDEIVFVVRAGHTPAQRVTAALDLLSDENRISLVLNRAPWTQNVRSYGAYDSRQPIA